MYLNEICLSAKDFTSIDFRIYSNSAESGLIIEGITPFKSFAIYDSFGRFLSEVTLPTETITVEVSFSETIASEIYLISVSSKDIIKIVKFQKI